MEPMQLTRTLVIDTRPRSMTNISRAAQEYLERHGAREGLLTAFIRHTSASLTIQENTDPDMRADLIDALDRLAPEGPLYRHSVEGPDDMPSHIKAAITSPSIGIPVIDGRLMLGTWQALYVLEHRAAPHRREVVLHFQGTRAALPARQG